MTMDAMLVTGLKGYIYDILGCCQEVHRELGPFLNEYMYQDALEIALGERGIPFVREYHFQTCFHGTPLSHSHKADFLCKEHVIIECKAVSVLGIEHRQQLWNYMRLSGKRVGILYNFAPIKDQCERYYLNPKDKSLVAF